MLLVEAACFVPAFRWNAVPRDEVIRGDDDVALAAEVVEVGLIGIVHQAGGSLLALVERAVQRNDGRSRPSRSSGIPK